MVNLLLVSHSRKLAEGAAEMVQQMVSSEVVKISIAAGIGDGHRELGTNAVEIAEAIQDIHSTDGVLVLMDLGSAILSTEMALDLIPSDMRANVRICLAPFIEGAITAAVQAGLGNSLEIVYQEAMASCQAKYSQLVEKSGGNSIKESVKEISPISDDKIKEIIVTVRSLHGLHARPAVKFVQTAASFDAEIMVNNLTTKKGPASAKSLIAITMLGVLKGHQIQVTAMGQQQEEALEALSNLVENNFGEALEEDQIIPGGACQPKNKFVSSL